MPTSPKAISESGDVLERNVAFASISGMTSVVIFKILRPGGAGRGRSFNATPIRSSVPEFELASRLSVTRSSFRPLPAVEKWEPWSNCRLMTSLVEPAWIASWSVKTQKGRGGGGGWGWGGGEEGGRSGWEGGGEGKEGFCGSDGGCGGPAIASRLRKDSCTH